MSSNTIRPWLFRTYAGHSTAKASNELYRTNLAKGQTGLSVAFDLPTRRAMTVTTNCHVVKWARLAFRSAIWATCARYLTTSRLSR